MRVNLNWVKNFSVYFCSMVLVFACGISSALAASEWALSYHEEKQIRDQVESTGLPPNEQFQLEQRMIKCAEESKREKDWHFGDYLMDDLLGNESECVSLSGNNKNGFMRDRNASIDAIIDKQLKETLEKIKK